MAVKTITIRTNAYDALKALKEPRESFSDTILRVAKRRSLNEFVGVLSEESGRRLEEFIMKNRERHRKTRQERIKRIRAAMEHGSS